MSRTIQLVTPHWIARGDFNSRGLLCCMGHSVPPARGVDVASLTLAALGLVKAAPRRVWVLTTAAAKAIEESACLPLSLSMAEPQNQSPVREWTLRLRL